MVSSGEENEGKSSRSSKRSTDRDSKAKESSRRARDQSACLPGAVRSSSTDERKKRRSVADHDGRTSRSSSSFAPSSPRAVSSTSSSKEKRKSNATRSSSSFSPRSPGAVSSTSRDKRKSSRASRSSLEPGSPGAVSSTRRDKRKSSVTPDSPHRTSSLSPRSSKPGISRQSSATRSATSEKSRRTSSLSPRPSRSSRPSDAKSSLMANTREPGFAAMPPIDDMENGIVAETVDDTEVQNLRAESETTANALRKMNREVGALRSELQRTKEEQTSRRGMPFWRKICLLMLAICFIGGIAAAIVALTGGGGDESNAQQETSNAPEASSEPTAQATTAIPDVSATPSPTIDLFFPPTQDVCSAVSEGRPVDGQESMIEQPFSVSMGVNLTVDVDSGVWWPGLQQTIQQLVMPPIVGCGNTTLDVFVIGNAQVDQDFVSVVPCDDTTDGSCYVVELEVVLFLKQVVSYDIIEDLSQHVEGVFQNSTSLLLDAQDEDSEIVKDIGTLTSKPVTKSPSQQPSKNPTDDPSASPSSYPSTSPSLQPTNLSTPGPTTTATPPGTPGPTLAPASGATLTPIPGPTALPTPFPTPGPTLAPVSGPTIPPTPSPTPALTLAASPGPTIAPSLGPSPLPTPLPSSVPTMDPTSGPSSPPTVAPTPGPTTAAPTPVPTTGQPSDSPSSAPTSRRTALETMLARFAPFDGNKGRAMDWLVADTWVPPPCATDEVPLFEERFALAVFYYATTGDGWNNNDGWLTATTVCGWNGISCFSPCASVTHLALWTDRVNYNLIGDLPAELRALTNLEDMQFAWNRDLSGSIPSFLTALTKLTELNLGDTGRIGSIPSEVWSLTKLQYLRFAGNFLTGAIPTGISALTDIKAIGLPFNDLVGSLPNEFSGMTQLTSLGINENSFTGAIPPLPTSLSVCVLATEGPDTLLFASRKTEGNCFTDTTNAPGFCILDANQC